MPEKQTHSPEPDKNTNRTADAKQVVDTVIAIIEKERARLKKLADAGKDSSVHGTAHHFW